jgi:hypothetical protein
MGYYKSWSAAGFSTWPLAFSHIYINDLPATINSISRPIVFADDTNVIVAHPELFHLQGTMNDVLPN